MLASQFLSVVIDEGVSDYGRGSTNTTSDDDAIDDTVLHSLERRCKLPQVLLAECSITISNQEDKLRQSRRKCRFEAYVTPVPKQQSLERLEQEVEKSPGENSVFLPEQNVEDLLQGVEAVYSDEEGANESGADYPKSKIVCTVCKQSTTSDGSPVCRKCSLLYRKNQTVTTDEYIPRGFQCTVCGKVYSQRSVLKKHETVHSGYRLRCKVCGIDFTQRSSLLRHCKRIHGIASDSEITTPLVPPDLRTVVGSGNKQALGNAVQLKHIPGLADHLTSLLAKREDETITLAVSKIKQGRTTPFSIDPLAVMTLTSDGLVDADQND